MTRRGQKNLLDLTRESGNVRRALRSNRGLNHELKITYQHIASEQMLNDVGWRNKERLIRRHAVHVLGPYQKVIARMRVEREQQQLITNDRNRSTSVILPPVNRPRSSSNASSQHNQTAGSSSNPGSNSNSLDDLTTIKPLRIRSPVHGSISVFPNSREFSSSPFTNEAITRQQRAKTSITREAPGTRKFVSLLEEKLDKFHIHLLEDTQTNSPFGRRSPPDNNNNQDGERDEETIDTARLSRLRASLIHSVNGARLRTSARMRRQEASGLSGPNWQALAAAMHFTSRPQNLNLQQRQTQADRNNAANNSNKDNSNNTHNKLINRATMKRPSTIMEVPSRLSNRPDSTAPTPLTRNATIH